MGHRMRLVSPLLAAVVVGMLVLAACDDDDEAVVTPTSTTATARATESATLTPTLTPTPTTTATATPEPKQPPPSTPEPTIEPTPVPTHPAGTRSGDANVDLILQLLDGADYAGMAAKTAVLERPCEEPRPISPQPFICREGQTVGTPIRGVWVIDVEGGFWPPEMYGAAARQFAEFAGGLVAVYHVDQPESDTIILFFHAGIQGRNWVELHLLDGQITHYVFSAGPPPDELLADPAHADWILPPPP